MCACFVADSMFGWKLVSFSNCMIFTSDSFSLCIHYKLHYSREQDGEGDVLCSLQALQQRLQDLAESQEQTLRYG